MRLKAAVLEIVRGAAGATLLVAVGCAGSEPIAPDPAGPVAPAPPMAASPPSGGAAPGTPGAGKPESTPSVVIAPVAPPTGVETVLAHGDPVPPGPQVEPGAPPSDEPRHRGRQRRRRDRALEPLAQPMHLPPDIAVACGRG